MYVYGKVAFVEVLLYVGLSCMEIQHALCMYPVTVHISTFLFVKVKTVMPKISLSFYLFFFRILTTHHPHL